MIHIITELHAVARMAILLDVLTFVVNAQADAQLRQHLLQVAVQTNSASTTPNVSTVSTKPRPRRKNTRQNTPASLIDLSAESATTRFPIGSPSVGIATTGGMKMTGATHVRQTTATKFSRSFSLPKITRNRVPRVDVLSVTNFGTVSRSMNVIMMVRRAERKVMKPEGTVTDAKIMAGKFGTLISYLHHLSTSKP